MALKYLLRVDIYFLQRNEEQHKAALALRDSVLRLRRDGAFIAVPLHRVNTEPIGPHPAGTTLLYGIIFRNQIYCL